MVCDGGMSLVGPVLGVAAWMERGLLAALDPTAEEGPPDLLSSVQSIMCERPSL